MSASFLLPLASVSPVCADQVGSGTFSHDDHRMMAPLEPLLQHRQQSVCATQLEANFRYQNEVGFVACQGRMRGDKATVASHHLDQTDTVVRRVRF